MCFGLVFFHCPQLLVLLHWYCTKEEEVLIKIAVFRKNVADYGASREYNDLGFITFDLKADLNPLFNWNVKQLFLYLTAEYETANNKLNQVPFL